MPVLLILWSGKNILFGPTQTLCVTKLRLEKLGNLGTVVVTLLVVNFHCMS